MYVPQFVLGIITTLVIEFALIIGYSIYKKYRGDK